MEPDLRRQLLQLQSRYRVGYPVTNEDLELAAPALASVDFREKLIACEAVLRGTAGRDLKRKAVQGLRDLYQDELKIGEVVNVDLVLSLLRLPPEDLVSDPMFTNYVATAIRSRRAACRINAVLALERMAYNGHVGAHRMLDEAKTDPNDTVAENARNAYERLGKGISPEWHMRAGM